MARKGVFPIVATLAVVGVVLAVFSQTVMRDSNISTNTITTEQAYADLSGKMKRIGVQEVSVNPQQLDVSEFLDAKDELPDIASSYPFVVEGNGDVNIEIFSSGEKAAESGSDSFLTIMAKKFNAQHNKTSGDKTMSVSLRSVPSGTAAEYISTGKYQPECYTPSNTLFGELVKNEGVELTVEADRLAGNVAVAAYGVIANFALVATAIFNGVAQGAQPLVSECYGKSDRAGAKKLLILGSCTALALAAALYAVVFGATDSLVAVFNSENSAQMAQFAHMGMRLYFAGYFFAGFNIAAAGYLSATNRPAEASVTSLCRGMVAIVACSLVLSRLFGMNGVWAAFPASELLTALLTLFLLLRGRNGKSAGKNNWNSVEFGEK